MRGIIEKIIAEELRPMLAAHGADVELIEVTEDGVVRVRLIDACKGQCTVAPVGLIGIVENVIKSRIPEVKRVEEVKTPGV